MRLVRLICGLLGCLAAMASTHVVQAQTYRHAGTEFIAVRRLLLPEEKSLQIGVAEFHHHGLLNQQGTNVLVLTADRKPMAHSCPPTGPGRLLPGCFSNDRSAA